MKSKKRFLTYVITAVVLAVCIICSVVFTTLQSLAEPYNPLNDKANPSQMLLLSGNGLNVTENALNNNENGINKAEAGTAPSQPPTLPTEDEISDHAEAVRSTSELKQIPVENNVYQEEYVIPQTQNTYSNQYYIQNNSAENNKANDSNSNLNQTSASNNTAQNVQANSKLPSGIQMVPTEPQKPSNQHSPSSNVINSEYFTTTIKNGETIKSRHYSFEINHLNKQLNVKEISIYINSSRLSQFNGSVFLSEGKNNIRVLVVYTDKTGKETSVYKDYIIYVDLGDILISTNLSNTTVDTDTITFYANAVLDGTDIPLTVKCGNDILNKSNNIYTASLKTGENVITITAQAGSHKRSVNYTVISTATKEFSLHTSLENITVNTNEYTFTAYCLNGTENARLSVKCNGKAVAGSTNYTVSLKNGSNTIRLKAVDVVNGETKTIEKSYIIRFIPPTTEETAPKLLHTNVTNGMNITGNLLTLDLQPVDYLGNRIYYDGISVSLNGVPYSYKWTSEYTSYLLYLQNGTNVLEIRITDKEGRYTDYSFNINCLTVADGEKIGTVTVSMDANVLGLGNLLQPVQMDIYQGETTAQAIKRLLDDNGFQCYYTGTVESGFYLNRISKVGIAQNVSIPAQLVNDINADGLMWTSQKYTDSIGENDYTQGSGWMYTVNDSFQGAGLSDIPLKDGDVLKLRYTLAYGKDIGGYSTANGDGGDNYSTIY